MTYIVTGLCIVQATAQDVTDSLPVKKHPVKRSHVEVGMNYQSDNVYLGRKDSSALPYFVPAVSFYHKSGLYFTGSLSYLKSSTASRVDLFTLDAGYMFSAHEYEGVFTVSKYFYNGQSTNVSSTIEAAAAYQNSYDLGFIKPSFTATLNIGSKLDLEGMFELSHTFLLLNDDLDISPTVAAAGSTLNFYDYYSRRRYTIKKKNAPKQTGIASVTGSVEQASKFRIMDYEAILPIEYSIGKCTFSFTPTYCIPVNASTINIHTVRDNGTVTDRTKMETIGNSFFFTAGVSIMF